MNKSHFLARWYGYLELVPTSGKVPRYRLTASYLEWPELAGLERSDGRVELFLNERILRGNPDVAPAHRLQAVRSYNLSGLIGYNAPVDGATTAAVGYPPSVATYGAQERENPLYDCRDDAYLFLLRGGGSAQDGEPIPTAIEWGVFKHCRQRYGDLLRAWRDGDRELRTFIAEARAAAQPVEKTLWTTT